MPSDDDIRREVDVSQQHAPGADAGARAHRRGRVHEGCVPLVAEPQPLGDQPPAHIVVGPSGTDHDPRLRMIVRALDRPDDRNARYRAARKVCAIVEESEEVPGRLDRVDGADGLRGLSGEATGSDQQ